MENLKGGGTTEPTEAPAASSSSSSSGASAGSAVDGACGKFKDWGLTAPSGFKTTVCSDQGDSASIILSGSGSPSDACKVIKTWADGTGAKLTTQSDMGGTTALIYTKDTTNMTIACTDMTGSTTISVSLSPGG